VVAKASAIGEPLLITLCTLLETEWVLRSRYGLNRATMTAAVIAMLETPGIEFEHAPTFEEALYLFGQVPSVDFASGRGRNTFTLSGRWAPE
jgi:predicted nucleic-acid-binding protein